MSGETGQAPAAESEYAGRWLLAIGVIDLTRKQSGSAAGSHGSGSRYPLFRADSYLHDAGAVTVELLQRPGAVPRSLPDWRLRALSTDQDPEHEQRLADAADARPPLDRRPLIKIMYVRPRLTRRASRLPSASLVGPVRVLLDRFLSR